MGYRALGLIDFPKPWTPRTHSEDGHPFRCFDLTRFQSYKARTLPPLPEILNVILDLPLLSADQSCAKMLQMCANCCFFSFCTGDFATFDFSHFAVLFDSSRLFDFSRFAILFDFSRLFDFSTDRILLYFSNFCGFFFPGFSAQNLYCFCSFSTFHVQFGILHLSAPTAVRKRSTSEQIGSKLFSCGFGRAFWAAVCELGCTSVP